MVNWIKGFITQVLPPSVIGQGAEETEKRSKPHLFDVADGYFVAEEAKKWGINWIRRSWSDFEEFRNRVSTRRKVRRSLASFYDLPSVLDEVTEKIIETSNHDDRVKGLFS